MPVAATRRRYAPATTELPLRRSCLTSIGCLDRVGRRAFCGLIRLNARASCSTGGASYRGAPGTRFAGRTRGRRTTVSFTDPACGPVLRGGLRRVERGIARRAVSTGRAG
jgi:hypothetical protein